MKSCLGILFVFLTFVFLVGGGLIYYLSKTSEFSRAGAPATAPASPSR